MTTILFATVHLVVLMGLWCVGGAFGALLFYIVNYDRLKDLERRKAEYRARRAKLLKEPKDE